MVDHYFAALDDKDCEDLELPVGFNHEMFRDWRIIGLTLVTGTTVMAVASIAVALRGTLLHVAMYRLWILRRPRKRDWNMKFYMQDGGIIVLDLSYRMQQTHIAFIQENLKYSSAK
ncbi:hypothetical protein Tco_0731540 [Tanacetum coccineum]